MAEHADIVVVCTANVCRSPMAAGLLRHALAAEPEPLRSLTVTSAGVAAQRGARVTEHSVTALKRVGIDISGHVSQPLTHEMLDRARLVLCMTDSHRAVIQLHSEDPDKPIYLFREFVKEGADKEIPDPFGGPLSLYEASRDEMVAASPSLIEYLKTAFGGAGKK